MNNPLRKAINIKNMFRRKCYKCKSPANWEIYRKHRNNATEQRGQCMKGYLRNTCAKSDGGKQFWKCIKPLISNKKCAKSNYIILMENDNAVNNSTDVSSLMNEYYVNITKTIGYDDPISQGDTFDGIVSTHVNNRRVLYIKDNIVTSKSMFCFKIVDLHMCLKSCERLILKKTSFDNIPPKLTVLIYYVTLLLTL